LYMYLLNQMLLILWKNRKLPVLLLLVWLSFLTAFGQDPYLLGIARLQEGSYEQARIHFEQVLATQTNDPEGLLKIAETYYLTSGWPLFTSKNTSVPNINYHPVPSCWMRHFTPSKPAGNGNPSGKTTGIQKMKYCSRS